VVPKAMHRRRRRPMRHSASNTALDSSTPYTCPSPAHPPTRARARAGTPVRAGGVNGRCSVGGCGGRPRQGRSGNLGVVGRAKQVRPLHENGQRLPGPDLGELLRGSSGSILRCACLGCLGGGWRGGATPQGVLESVSGAESGLPRLEQGRESELVVAHAVLEKAVRCQDIGAAIVLEGRIHGCNRLQPTGSVEDWSLGLSINEKTCLQALRKTMFELAPTRQGLRSAWRTLFISPTSAPAPRDFEHDRAMHT
jgi:hypothetical protein